jgi:hypothetical protein
MLKRRLEPREFVRLLLVQDHRRLGIHGRLEPKRSNMYDGGV